MQKCDSKECQIQVSILRNINQMVPLLRIARVNDTHTNILVEKYAPLEMVWVFECRNCEMTAGDLLARKS